MKVYQNDKKILYIYGFSMINWIMYDNNTRYKFQLIRQVAMYNRRDGSTGDCYLNCNQMDISNFYHL